MNCGLTPDGLYKLKRTVTSLKNEGNMTDTSHL